MKGRVVRPLKKIVKRDVEVVGKADQCGVVGFAFAGFILTDSVLTDVQIHGELQLGDSALLSDFF